MRHRNKRVVLGREKAPRKALLRNLAQSVILHERIRTTEAKAKAIRPIVERLVTLGKSDTLFARRRLLSKLYSELAVKKVLEVLSPKFKARAGGYTRIIKVGTRQGDGARMAVIEFVD